MYYGVGWVECLTISDVSLYRLITGVFCGMFSLLFRVDVHTIVAHGSSLGFESLFCEQEKNVEPLSIIPLYFLDGTCGVVARDWRRNL
jgi:hypothetical protein